MGTAAAAGRAGSPPDKLTVATPDKLTGALYERLDGVIVDARCIRPYDNVQSAHTAAEHLVYTTMWKMLGARDDQGNSREGIVPLKLVAGKVAISVRNLRRVVRSLEEKLALEVTAYEDKTRSIPRRYRIWGFRAAMERRRRAGYHFVYRNRNLITLARAHSTPPDKLTGEGAANMSPGAPDNLAPEPTASMSGGAPVSLTAGPPDNMDGIPPDNLSALVIREAINPAETTSSRVVAALNTAFGYVDDDAVRRLIFRCRARAADASDEEIAMFIGMTVQRIRKMTGLTNAVGMLITQVPKCFEGESFRQYRAAEKQRREAEVRQAAELCAEAQRVLTDPDASEAEKQWAQQMLGGA